MRTTRAHWKPTVHDWSDRSLRRKRGSMHNRTHIYQYNNIGAKAADIITEFAGAWLFIFLHIIWFTLWFVFRLDINTLTLIVSLEAIFLSSFVLITQSLSCTLDHHRNTLQPTQL